ncbi:MAG TPA: hypothetical protein VGK19_03885 [Capsulimonadaceae bacterium]|jgi:hypothetical protein
MSLQVIEGTWEEIKQHEAQLVGWTLRVTVLPQVHSPRHASEHSPREAAVDAVLGKYADIPGGTDAFASAKQAEIEFEDRS